MIIPETVTLKLSDEFKIACLLYGVQPEALLQEFVFNVVLPGENLWPEAESVLATDYFVEFIKLKYPGKPDYSEEQKEFLRRKEKQRRVLCRNLLKHGRPEGEEALRFFYKIWVREWQEAFGGLTF